MVQISYYVRTAQAQAALSALEARMTMTSGAIAAGSRIADAALMAVSASFIAMGAGAFVAYNAVNQFQESLTTVRALGGVTEAQMYELADSINEVSAQFGVSGDEIAAGAVMLSKAGLTVDQVNESIGAMTALSKANGIAFEEAARMTVFAVNTFGKEFSEAGQLMDAMQVATQESILDIGDLQKAFAFAGSTAVMSGVSFEQLVSIMAVLSNRALEAGISARSVNKMFLDMITNTDELQEFMDGMGMTFSIIRDGKLDIDALMNAFSGQNLTLEMLQSASDVFTVRALRSFGLLIGAADEYQTMLADVTNSQGALMDVVDVQMTSFTALFAKLRQEFLAPLRSPEVMQQISVMVDSLIKMFNTLKPELINTILVSLNGFSNILTSETFLNAIRFAADGLLTIFQALRFIGELATGPGGFIIKAAAAFKIATMFVGGFALSLQKTTIALYENTGAYVLMGATLAKTTKANDAAILKNQMLTMSYTIMGNVLQFVTGAMMGVVTAGMMIGASDSPMMIGISILIAGLMALNTTLMISEALMASFKYAITGPGFVGVFTGLLLAMGAVAYGFHQQRKDMMSQMESYSVADNGMMVGRKKYDSGGHITASDRHQMVFVEPGETIIPKTQNMLGSGGITVNVGDVYAQDGTDFATKLADALPFALRTVSDRGGI